MKIGWTYSTWSTPPVPCSACGTPICSGKIRVDAPAPSHPDFRAICTSCDFKITELGIDPVPGAVVPGWATEGGPE